LPAAVGDLDRSAAIFGDLLPVGHRRPFAGMFAPLI
jgi:hypothetical protein